MSRKRNRVLFKNEKIKIVLPKKFPSLIPRLFIEGCFPPTAITDPDDFVLELFRIVTQNAIEIADETIIIHNDKKRKRVTIKDEHDRIRIARSERNGQTVETIDTESVIVEETFSTEKRRETFQENENLLAETTDKPKRTRRKAQFTDNEQTVAESINPPAVSPRKRKIATQKTEFRDNEQSVDQPPRRLPRGKQKEQDEESFLTTLLKGFQPELIMP